MHVLFEVPVYAVISKFSDPRENSSYYMKKSLHLLFEVEYQYMYMQ